MKHGKHLLFVLVILLAVGVVGVVAGGLLTPDDFGWRNDWYYRAESLEKEKSRPAAYAPTTSCLSDECHGENAAKEEHTIELGGGHEQMGCQACHGPAIEHAESKGTKPAPKLEKDMQLCWNCHKEAPGRPGKFPVIADLADHVDDVGGDEQESCFDCHDPHTCEADY